MKTKVLMVCLGNICRSPLAEGILRSKVDSDKVLVDSAGTAGYHIGNPPDKRSIKIAKERGLDISHQKCRQFTTQDFKDFDIIYVMDEKNLSDVASMTTNQADLKKVKLLMTEVNLGIKYVPDPYYCGDYAFLDVYQMMDKACEAIAKKLN